MEKIKVAVKNESFVVRDPQTKKQVTTDGVLVRKSAYWLKRIKCGDVILVDEKQVQASKPKKETAKKAEPSFNEYQMENIS